MLSAFPSRAAGPYEDASGDAKYDLYKYVSSYTLTLTSLIMETRRGGYFIRLPLTVTENERVSIKRIRRFKPLVDNDATPTAVLKMLKKAQWVHLTCRAILVSSVRCQN